MSNTPIFKWMTALHAGDYLSEKWLPTATALVSGRNDACSVALWWLTAALRCRNPLHHDKPKRPYKPGKMSQRFRSTAFQSLQSMFDRERDLKTILVGNIHSCVTEEILFELFLQAGPVDEVCIFRDGQQAPYGCVYYKHAEAVPYAVELLNGIWLYGQPIKLQRKTDGLYHRNEVFSYHTGDGLIADSANAVQRDDVVLNLNRSQSVEIQSNEAYSWSDMVYSRRLQVCPPAVWFFPPLQLWHSSGHSSGTSLHRSASSAMACNFQKVLYGERCMSILTPSVPVSAFISSDSDCKL